MADKTLAKNRETGLDILRIIAMFFVVSTHCQIREELLTFGSMDWNFAKYYYAIVVWHVPTFIMISGRFFLDPERNVTFKRIKQQFLKILIGFAFWNVIYQSIEIIRGTYSSLNIKGFIFSSGAFIGPYHFWFLWMIMGLYLITPILRKIVEDKKITELFLILFFIFSFLTKICVSLPIVGENIQLMLHDLHFHLTLEFSGYYVLGYYLYANRDKIKHTKLIYAVGLLMILSSGVLLILLNWKNVNIDLFAYLSPYVIVESSAVFLFFVNSVNRIKLSEKSRIVISKFSSYTFGIYFTHVLFTNLISNHFSEFFNLPEAIRRPILTLIVFFSSFLLTYIVKKIPVIGKYVV